MFENNKIRKTWRYYFAYIINGKKSKVSFEKQDCRYFAFTRNRRVILLTLDREKNEHARNTRLGLKGLAKGFALI